MLESVVLFDKKEKQSPDYYYCKWWGGGGGEFASCPNFLSGIVGLSFIVILSG